MLTALGCMDAGTATVTGALLLGIVALFRPDGFESLKAIFKQPLWMLLGGMLGACALLRYVRHTTARIGLGSANEADGALL